MFIPLPRATVLIVSGPPSDPNKKHLFVLLTQGLGEGDLLLMVSICSIVPNTHYDDACILNVGDHPFIKHPSYVRYDAARRLESKKIVATVAEGKMIPMTPVTPELYKQICDGLLTSLYAAPEIKSFLLWHKSLA